MLIWNNVVIVPLVWTKCVNNNTSVTLILDTWTSRSLSCFWNTHNYCMCPLIGDWINIIWLFPYLLIVLCRVLNGVSFSAMRLLSKINAWHKNIKKKKKKESSCQARDVGSIPVSSQEEPLEEEMAVYFNNNICCWTHSLLQFSSFYYRLLPDIEYKSLCLK